MGEPEKPSLTAAAIQVAANLVPVVGGAMAAALAYADELDRWRIAQMTEAARAEAGGDDRLLERLRSDDRFIDMVVVAVEGARRTAWEAKRILLGRVLGQAFTDDADIDDAAMLLTTLKAIEAPHVRILAGVALGRLRESGPTPPGLPPAQRLPEPYRAALLSHGLVDNANWDSEVNSVTPYGHRLLDYLRQAEPEGPASGQQDE